MTSRKTLEKINAYVMEQLKKYGRIIVGSSDSSKVCYACLQKTVKQNENGLYFPTCKHSKPHISVEIGVPFTLQQLYEENLKSGKGLNKEFNIEEKARRIAEEACSKYNVLLCNVTVVPIGDFGEDLTEIKQALFDGLEDFVVLPKELEV